jgi:Heterokaryon incompatibility protein (HET)
VAFPNGPLPLGIARAGPLVSNRRTNTPKRPARIMQRSHKPEPQYEGGPQLALVTLTPENKQHLFQNAIEASKKSMEKTQALLARLEQFDPSIARDFGFKNVAVSQAPFRLLRSIPMRTKAMNGLKKIFGRSKADKGRSNIITSSSTSDTKFTSFIALSYCWHNQDWRPAPGCKRLEGWPISWTMLNALLDMRLSQDEGIWIDACCIDQSNDEEKMQAIGAMDVIYKSARLVIVILEDVYLPTADADIIQNMLDKWHGQKWYEIEITKESVPNMSRAVPRLLSSRWFTRAWCSHEFQLGAASVFLIPTEGGLGGYYQLDITIISHLHGMYPRSHLYPEVFNHFPFYGFETLIRATWYRNTKWSRRSPMAQFNGIIDLNSSFETDKIGIGMNVAGLQLYFTGPKKSVHECRWILAMLALSAGDLSALCGTGSAIQTSAETNVPSWLRWNNRFEDFVACLSDFAIPETSHILSISPECINLDLLVLEHYSIRTPSTNSVLIATTFLDRLSKDILDQLQVPAGRRQVEILACSLDCGLAWLVKSMTFSQDIAKQMEWYIESFKFDFWPLVASLLIDAYPSEEITISNFTNEQKRLVSQCLYFNLRVLKNPGSGSDYGSGIFGTPSDNLEEHCMWLDWGTACGKALTFIAAGRAFVPEYRLAVPAALGGPPCSTMDRLWLLKPRGSNANSEWNIVEKIRLVTVMPLEEDGENVVLRTGQTIRG